jgi:hypothetical protein
MPEIRRPSHLMPSAHQLPRNYQADRDPIAEESSNSDADDRTTLAEILKGKVRGADSSGCSTALGEELATSCPKGPRTTVRKRKAETVPRSDSNPIVSYYRQRTCM